jgi:hypothetical protein
MVTNTSSIRKRLNLPSRPGMAVNTVDGALDAYEADYPIFLNITQEDIDISVCNDPKRCIAANAAIRMYGAMAVDFHRTVAYIIWPHGKGPYKNLPHKYGIRYTMPVETMRQVANFDAGVEMFPTQMNFLAVTAGRTLHYRRDAVRAWRKAKNTKSIQPKSTDGPRGGHRYIVGFIGVRGE